MPKGGTLGKQLTFDSEPHFEIEITYSPDSAMIHRFINFEISPQNHEKVAEALQKYISLVEQDDNGAFMYHQIQEQYEERLTAGMVSGSRDFDEYHDSKSNQNEKQITLVMVMDPDSLHPHASLRKHIGQQMNGTQHHPEARQIMLRKYDIDAKNQQGHPLEKSLSKWIALFLKGMGFTNKEEGMLLQRPRFSEIRPI